MSAPIFHPNLRRRLADVVDVDLDITIGPLFGEDESVRHVVCSGDEILGSFSRRSMAALFIVALREVSAGRGRP